mgnify:CR=1 FL=1
MEDGDAAADQRLRAAAVEDGARVDLRRDLEGDARREVGLDQAGDHIRGGSLRRQHEVDAGGAGQLGQAGDERLDVLARHHHQVRHLVDDADDVGQLLRRNRHPVVERVLRGLGGGGLLRGRERELLLLRLARLAGELGVEAGDVLHPALAEDLVALAHLGDQPLKGGGHALGVGLDRHEEVRQLAVDLQLDHLGVDHDEAQVRRAVAVEQRGDERVDAHRFALAGGAGDQAVRHLREVGDDGLARDAVDAEDDGDLHLGARVEIGRAHV